MTRLTGITTSFKKHLIGIELFGDASGVIIRVSRLLQGLVLAARSQVILRLINNVLDIYHGIYNPNINFNPTKHLIEIELLVRRGLSLGLAGYCQS